MPCVTPFLQQILQYLFGGYLIEISKSREINEIEDALSYYDVIMYIIYYSGL